jgi:hypothetical protein
MKASVSIFREIRKFLHEAAHKLEYRVRPQDFTRPGKLGFATISLLMLRLLKSRCSPSLTTTSLC